MSRKRSADLIIPEKDTVLEVRQQDFLDTITEQDDIYQNYLDRLSPEKIGRVRKSIKQSVHGLYAVAPLTCKGPKGCPFINHCPIPSIEDKTKGDYGPDSDYPKYMPCVLESIYQKQKIIDYVKYLNVDPSNPIEMAVVNELAIIDLYKNRAAMILGNGDRDGEGRDFLRQDEDVKQAADTAYTVKRTILHPVFDVLDRLEGRRRTLMTDLLETRKGKAEYDLKKGVTQEDNNLINEIIAVRKLLETASKNSINDPVSTEKIISIDD